MKKHVFTPFSFVLIVLIFSSLVFVTSQAQSSPANPTATGVYGQGGNFNTIQANYGTVNPDSLSQPSSVDVDASGNLYIVDYSNHRALFFPAGSTSATRVYGQEDNFYTSTETNWSNASANGFSYPAGSAVYQDGNLYVVDMNNNRVLYYPAGSTTATRVYGQGGSFTSAEQNKGGISADSLYTPSAVAVDQDGNLYVVDYNNSRVLYYPAGSTTATRVYGQGGSFSSNEPNKGGISANSLSYPGGATLDSSGNLYVTDTQGHRVLYYPAGSTTATRVYGQGGSFTTNTANKGGTSANSLSSPGGLAVDSSNNLYVADGLNHRVLYYPAGSTTATRVYGQGSSFATAVPNLGGVSANSLDHPIDAALDASGNLYVADYGNNRVLYYPAGSTTATRVYGQSGSLTTNLYNTGGITALGLHTPIASALDRDHNLYVADKYGHRVLYYPAGSTTPTRVYGQNGSFTSYNAYGNDTHANSLFEPMGLVVDGSNNLYIADNGNHRVLYYPAGSTTATRVYGQGGVFTTNTLNKGGISANSLNGPRALALDSGGNLYVADEGNNRVLYYPAGSTTATRVYGQDGVFTTNTKNKGGVSASSLNSPVGVGLDSSGSLYVADTDNNRVLYYPAGSTSATRVYGQGGNFTTNTENKGGVSAGSFDEPVSVALDYRDNLYVADGWNHRALFFPAGSTSATRVYGQDGDFTTNTENKGGVSANSLAYPSSLALDNDGNLYISEYYNNRVLFYFNPIPEMGVSAKNQAIADGDDTPSGVDGTDLGIAAVGQPVSQTFTIANSGSDALLLTGSPQVSLASGTQFLVTTQPASSVGVGGSTYFTITFNSAAAGRFFDTVSIASSDHHTSPYSFVVSGTAKYYLHLPAVIRH